MRKFRIIITTVLISICLYGCGDKFVEEINEAIENEGGVEGVINNAEELFGINTESYVIDPNTGAIIFDENEMHDESVNTEEFEDSRYLVGDKTSFYTDNSGMIDITLTDWGRQYGTDNGNIIYINYVIENVGNVDVSVGESLFEIYADNYKVETLSGSNSVYSMELSSGRKMSGTLYAKLIPDQYTIIEVECGPAVYLIWDASFVESMLGSYYWRGGDNEGVDITIGYDENGDLAIAGRCWNSIEAGMFDSYVSTINAGNIEFADPYTYGNKLIVYPTVDGGIYVEQYGDIKNDQYSIATTVSFTGTYERVAN